MTARMANPSPRALKRRDLTPTPITRERKKRGAATAPDIASARAAKKSNASAASAAEIDVNKPLTDKQKQFVQQWAKGDSLQNAALRAGYSDDGVAYRLARQPNILAYKAQFEAKYEEAAQMTRKKVMDMHLEAFEMAKLMSEPATMVSAITGNIMVDRLNSMSDAELLKVITSGNALELPHAIEVGDSGEEGE